MKSRGKGKRGSNRQMGGTIQTGTRFVEANPTGNRAERRLAASKRKRVAQ